jgi:hypothetical protein
VTTRSTRLLVGHVDQTGLYPQFVCPPATVALIKDVRAWNNSASQSLVLVSLETSDSTALFYLLNEPLESGKAVSLMPWVVMESGDVLLAWTNSGQFEIWVSGALLPVNSQ